MIWTMTVLRNGGQGPVERLEDAEFYFGRTERDIDLSRSRRHRGLRRLGEGVASLVREFDFVDLSLETGFSIEMSDAPQSDSSWKSLEMIAGSMKSFLWESPRSVYSCPGLEGSIEFEDNSHDFYNELPPIIWLRIKSLSICTIAWAFSNRVYNCPHGFQSTLHQWTDLGLMPRNDLRSLVLPGPPDFEYDFLDKNYG